MSDATATTKLIAARATGKQKASDPAELQLLVGAAAAAKKPRLDAPTTPSTAAAKSSSTKPNAIRFSSMLANEFQFLSNFYKCGCVLSPTVSVPTSEHVYQLLKMAFVDPDYVAANLCVAADPKEIKQLCGKRAWMERTAVKAITKKQLQIRFERKLDEFRHPPSAGVWSMQDKAMMLALLFKFDPATNPKLCERLVKSTGDRHLSEQGRFPAEYWTHTGQDRLGQMLMQVRTWLGNNDPAQAAALVLKEREKLAQDLQPLLDVRAMPGHGGGGGSAGGGGGRGGGGGFGGGGGGRGGFGGGGGMGGGIGHGGMGGFGHGGFGGPVGSWGGRGGRYYPAGWGGWNYAGSGGNYWDTYYNPSYYFPIGYPTWPQAWNVNVVTVQPNPTDVGVCQTVNGSAVTTRAQCAAAPGAIAFTPNQIVPLSNLNYAGLF